MMYQKNPKRSFTILLVILSFCFANIVYPVYSQVSNEVQSKFYAYQNAYYNYKIALDSNASDEIKKQKLSEYLKAKQEYESLIKTGSNQTYNNAHDYNNSINNLSDEGKSFNKTEDFNSQLYQSSQKNFVNTLPQKIQEFIKGKPNKKEMPLLEKIFWTIARALVPSIGVTVVTALLAPLSPVGMVIGGIVAGAIFGGLMTYAYEKRMNARYRDKPKEEAKIWRDITVSAVVEGIMAPFNLATGGLFGMVGPTVGNAIYKVAATQAIISFSGNILSSAVGGGVKNIWAKYYFKYPEKIASAERRIDEILLRHLYNGTQPTQEELKELQTLQKQIDEMKSEMYTDEDFIKDLKRYAVTSLISGFAGTIISDRYYTYETGRWADRISVKLFGSTSRGKTIASLLSTMPTNFASGIVNSYLEKSFINEKIQLAREKQKYYKPQSAGYIFYQNIIDNLQTKKDQIKPLQAGLDNMLNQLAVRSAQITVDALKYNLIDSPIQRKAEIEKRYRQQDPEWQKAKAIYEEYKKHVEQKPNPIKYRNVAKYLNDYKAWSQKTSELRKQWIDQCEKAQRAQNNPINQEIIKQIEQKYNQEIRLNQMLELGRLKGGEAHINAMKELLVFKDPKLANLPYDELNKLAVQAIVESYKLKSELATKKVQSIEENFKKYNAFKNGEIQLSEDEANRLKAQILLTSPSAYKTALVEQKIYELKSNNTRWSEIRARMPQILAEAESKMLKQYGGWGNVLLAEVYANGLAKFKYNPDGSVSFGKEFETIIKSIRNLTKKTLVDDFNNKINDKIINNILPKASEDDSKFEQIMSTYAKTTASTASRTLLELILNTSEKQLVSIFSRD